MKEDTDPSYLRLVLILSLGLITGLTHQTSFADTPRTLERGQVLPNSRLIGAGGLDVHLDDLKGRIKIVSIVPQLNTPVCDEQTHRFSEHNDGLDKEIEIVTISTNSSDDQTHFAEKANIHNITFLSDSPSYDFGTSTGLFMESHHILRRTVVVTDQDNIIRYVERVPMGQLPNFERAYEAVRNLLKIQMRKEHS